MATLRECTKCGSIKPLDDFHRKGDGHRPACKSCMLALAHEWRRANLDTIRERQRAQRAANPAAFRARARKAYSARDNAVHQGNCRRWRQEHPEQAKRWAENNKEREIISKRASAQVSAAIKRGILTRPGICEQCGASGIAIQAAHHDYSRPLEVRWLCRSCHAVWDAADPKTKQAVSA